MNNALYINAFKCNFIHDDVVGFKNGTTKSSFGKWREFAKGISLGHFLQCADALQNPGGKSNCRFRIPFVRNVSLNIVKVVKRLPIISYGFSLLHADFNWARYAGAFTSLTKSWSVSISAARLSNSSFDKDGPGRAMAGNFVDLARWINCWMRNESFFFSSPESWSISFSVSGGSGREIMAPEFY